MGKIGDLWVKLGLKKDEFSKGLKEAGDEVSGSGGNGGLAGKIKSLATSSAAVFAAIGAAAVAMADKFAHTSQRLGDQWDKVTAGLKASWKSFVSMVNSTDFSNMGQRLKAAFQDARNIAASKDAEFEVMNAIELEKSKMDKELEYLRIQMHNQKLTQQERVAAAEEYLRKIKPIYDKEEQYRASHARKVTDAYLNQAGVTGAGRRDYLEEFLTKYSYDSDIVQALDMYSRKVDLSGTHYRKLIDAIAKEHGGNWAIVESLAKIANYYQSTGNEQAKEVVDAIVAANYAAGAFDKETRRIQTVQNQAITGGGGGSTKANPVDKLLAQALDNIDDETERAMKELDKELDKMNGSVEFQPVEIVPPDMSAWDEFYNKYQDDLQRMQDLLQDFREVAIEGITDAIQELSDQFAGLEDINPGRVIQALLTPLADMAIKEGQILVAQGIGVEACKEALDKLEGLPAIAAGTALIAIGAAAKSGLQSLAKSGGKSTSASTYAGSSGSAGTQDLKTEMTVYVKGKIQGSDIVLAGQKTVNNWGR